jgi:Tfp pilus assembly protein PilN
VITINLLASGRETSSAPRFLANAACILTICAVALTYGCALQQTRGALRAQALDADTQIAEATSLTKRIEGLRQRHAELVNRLAAVHHALGDRSTSSDLLKVVSLIVPDDVWLTELKRSTDTVELNGRASSLAEITALVRELTAKVTFARNPELRSVTAENADDRLVLRFQIVGDLAVEPRR